PSAAQASAVVPCWLKSTARAWFFPQFFPDAHGNILPQIFGAKINARQKRIRHDGMFFLITAGGVI
ncbi:MAG: hypothetical protein WBW56_16850, partial [Syntrophobacteraceae bacterium]